MDNTKHSLGWDCSKAIRNGCSWAKDFIPVKGWTAEPTRKKTFDSFRVIDCPEFDRDAKNFGLKRMEENGNAELRG